MENEPLDVVMWVGHQFYPTADDYIVEGMNLGCCKRVPILPGEIVPGKSRCFLAHDNGKKGQGFIFGFFTISGVEVILDDPEKIAKYQEEYQNLNIQAVSSVQALTEPRRLCGQRTYGACYLVSGNDMDLAFQAAKPLSGKVDVKGDMVILLQPIPYPRMRFRGWRYMEPEFLAKYDWPQRSLPVRRTVRIEAAKPKKDKILPLLGDLDAKG